MSVSFYRLLDLERNAADVEHRSDKVFLEGGLVVVLDSMLFLIPELLDLFVGVPHLVLAGILPRLSLSEVLHEVMIRKEVHLESGMLLEEPPVGGFVGLVGFLLNSEAATAVSLLD